MRTRNKKLSDYGVSKERAKQLLKYCRECDETFLIRRAAEQENSSISDSLFQSVTKGLSYERLMGKEYIPIEKKDFYGYRRKMLSVLDKLLTN